MANDKSADLQGTGIQPSPHANKSKIELLGIIEQQNQELNALQENFDEASAIKKSLEQAAEVANLGYAIWDDQLDRDIYASKVMAKIHGMEVDEYL